MGIIDNINSPKDVKKLNNAELKRLAGEIRESLLKSVSKTGGHLASNLGIVEVTLALFKVFNLPEDKIVYDVGHQCYVHKILTGRKDRMDSLRTHGGLAGFPKIQESEYDFFNTGHSGNSVSVAMALAEANRLNEKDAFAIAVIGDGSLSNGLAFEGLNNAGRKKSNLVVVLNDNEMSISQNVGSLSNYLSMLRTKPEYSGFKKKVERGLGHIKGIGEGIAKALSVTKDSLKHLLIPDTVFEALGFTYVGPIDGHDIELLTTVFEQIKTIDKPVLVHVITKKGKGYSFAENNPAAYHGIGPFDIKKPLFLQQKKESYAFALDEILCKEAEVNKDVIGICAAMEHAVGMNKFHKKFPDRFYDAGICEGHAVTFAAGLAAAGKIPVVAIYSTFMQRAYDNIISDVALTNQHVVFCMDRAGITGQDGETHHGVFDVSFMLHIPNMTVLTPRNSNVFRLALKAAINDINGPVAIRYPKSESNDMSSPDDIFKAEFLREGKNVTVITMSQMTEVVMALDFDGDHINLNSIKPIDKDAIIKSAIKTKRVVTVEDNIVKGGMGETISDILKELDVKVVNLGIKDSFVKHGKTSELLDEIGLGGKDIQKVILE